MMSDKVEIIEYQEKYKDDFREISYQWLNNEGVLEMIDIHIIENFKQVILDGGHMFFARMGKDIVGTVSLIKVDDETFELAKFGVKEDFQGKRIGTKLIEKCIETAKAEEGVNKIILSTSSSLEASVYLYRKMGFKEIEDNDKYATTDKMFVMRF